MTRHNQIHSQLRHTYILSIMIIVMLFTVRSFANAAEPPSILVIVPGAPTDLNLAIDGKNGLTEAYARKKALETMFLFYQRDLKPKQPYILHVTSKQYTFEIQLDKRISGYDNCLTLDLKNQSLTDGKTLTRSFMLVGMRLITTLILEGALFYLMGYRTKASWLIFFAVNLLTQGFLNVWLNQLPPAMSYLFLSLIYGECFVYLIELILIPALIREKSVGKTILFVLAANTMSLVLGGWLIQQFSI